jgi:hypothetical protein
MAKHGINKHTQPNNHDHFQTTMGYYTTYYAFGLPSFLVVVIALYLLFTGTPIHHPERWSGSDT